MVSQTTALRPSAITPAVAADVPPLGVAPELAMAVMMKRAYDG
jgi:hypothetical protein